MNRKLMIWTLVLFVLAFTVYAAPEDAIKEIIDSDNSPEEIDEMLRSLGAEASGSQVVDDALAKAGRWKFWIIGIIVLLLLLVGFGIKRNRGSFFDFRRGKRKELQRELRKLRKLETDFGNAPDAAAAAILLSRIETIHSNILWGRYDSVIGRKYIILRGRITQSGRIPPRDVLRRIEFVQWGGNKASYVDRTGARGYAIWVKRKHLGLAESNPVVFKVRGDPDLKQGTPLGSDVELSRNSPSIVDVDIDMDPNIYGYGPYGF